MRHCVHSACCAPEFTGAWALATHMYIELHARSAFSFLEGASLPEDLVTTAANLAMPAMALLDRDGVYGAPRFHMAAKKAGLRAHIGAEISCQLSANRGQPSGFGNRVTGGLSFRLPLLATSRTGYQNLCRLITAMKLRNKKGEGAVTEGELTAHAAGLICLTGGEEGPLAAALLGRRSQALSAARQQIERLASIFGASNIYVELQRHFQREEETRNRVAIEIAQSLHLPLLATNGVCYTRPEQRRLQDVLTAIRHKRTLDTAGRLLTRNSERCLKLPREMARIFADLPHAIGNTQELSARLHFTLQDLGYEFPAYPVPAGETMDSFLRQRTDEGARGRYCTAGKQHLWQRARRQIDRELTLIAKLKLAGYFLIVWDIVCFCREQGILVQGRGSAANSAVCYSLGITAVDPIGMGLLFERFLSEERGEWPDIDLDLPSGDDRERVIQHVYQRYGERGAAMTANVITYRGKMAAREAGKVLGFDAETIAKVSPLISAYEFRDKDDTLERNFRDAGLDLSHRKIRLYYEMCAALQDIPRHLGQHSGGMVICQGRLDSVVPLEPASMPGRVVVQWDKEDCADLGIIKVDLLGLGMMAVLKDSVKLIRAHCNEEVDLSQLPQDDAKVYGALQKADTVGWFQVESRAQMSCLPRLHPERFYDIVVQVAIIRPGPIVGQMVNPFLARRRGREAVTYPHPSLEPVLERTLGVPLFQEQLLRIAMIAANFTGGEAEELRRAMGFKRSVARMKEIESRLRAGMTHNGLPQKAQEEILLAISSFALYGFPESHAASFALIAYASGWLKSHYLPAFTCALLNNQPMGFYSAATIVKDAQRHGLKVLPIDVTVSGWECSLEEMPHPDARFSERLALRVGMNYVRGLRAEAAAALLQARAAKPFASIDDLVHRVPELRREELTRLAEVGALNAVSGFGFQLSSAKPSRDESAYAGETESYVVEEGRVFVSRASRLKSETRNRIPALLHRRDALWQVARAVRKAGPLLDGPTDDSAPLSGISGGVAEAFADGAIAENAIAEAASPLAKMSVEERLIADFRGTGLTVGPHPMAYHRERLRALGILSAGSLATTPSGRRVRIAGNVITRQRPGTAKGFLFLSLEDETGVFNAIVVPDLFQQHRTLLTTTRFLMIEGILQNQDGAISIKADKFAPLAVSNAETESHDFH